MDNKQINYIIETKHNNFWSKHGYGSYSTIQDAQEFMQKYWPKDEYRIKQITEEIVFHPGD